MISSIMLAYISLVLCIMAGLILVNSGIRGKRINELGLGFIIIVLVLMNVILMSIS